MGKFSIRAAGSLRLGDISIPRNLQWNKIVPPETIQTAKERMQRLNVDPVREGAVRGVFGHTTSTRRSVDTDSKENQNFVKGRANQPTLLNLFACSPLRYVEGMKGFLAVDLTEQNTIVGNKGDLKVGIV